MMDIEKCSEVRMLPGGWELFLYRRPRTSTWRIVRCEQSWFEGVRGLPRLLMTRTLFPEQLAWDQLSFESVDAAYEFAATQPAVLHRRSARVAALISSLGSPRPQLRQYR